MKKFLKIAGIVVGVIIIGLAVTYLVFNRSLPEGHSPDKADSLAREMLASLNKPAWDSTQIIAWKFRGNHDYLWDKSREFVQLKKGKSKVLLNTKNLEKSLAFKDGQQLNGKNAQDKIDQAWKNFCNDSYWLVAPYKVFDPGTTRKLVTEDGMEKLLVTYNSGGVTPGDSYLWELGENGMPQNFRMWVSIIPVGGLKATWENWKTCQSGIKLATHHQFVIAGFDMKNVEAYSSMKAAGLTNDPFAALETL